MSSLESWKADAEQSIAAFAAFRAELAASCPTPGEVVVGVTPSGTLICELGPIHRAPCIDLAPRGTGMVTPYPTGY